jgi:hypothetical protein
MITVICGEDLVTSRNYYFDLKNKYREKNYEIKEIHPTQISEIQKGLGESLSLFSEKIVFFTQNLNKLISRKNVSINQLMILFKRITKLKSLIGKRGLAPEILSFPNSNIKDFKPSQTIFKLLDSCYPTNKKNFIEQINLLSDKLDDAFIFYMLIKHIRTL